jgi:CMP/dCMP kinase
VSESTVPLVVAIDGPAGSGKSTVARLVAERVGLPHLDTGAMYRSAALACLRRGVDPADSSASVELIRALTITVDGAMVTLDGEDVSTAIRTPDVDVAVGPVASNPEVRAELVAQQRRWAAERGGAVMEGRDIASVVFPDAPVKVYLTASEEERARRRSEQLGGEIGSVAAEIARRDHVDSTRAADPLRVADGSIVLDTTGLSIDDVVTRIAAMVDGARSRAQATAASVRTADDASPAADWPGSTAPRLTGVDLVGSGVVGRSLYRALWVVAQAANRGWFRARYHHSDRIPKTGGFLLAPVHRSNADFLLVGNVTRRRMRYVGKETIWNVKWFVPIANALGGIKVDRGTADRASMKRCLEVLEAGEPLVLFPEGTRKSGPIVEEIFEGAVYMAVKAGVPIVPVGIGGSGDAMPHGAKLPKRIPIDVVIGHPMTIAAGEKSSSRRAQRELSVRVREEIQRCFDEATRLSDARRRGEA